MMWISSRAAAVGVFSCLVLMTTAAQAGPDVIVGSLPNVSNYGPVSNMKAFAVGTTSCNIGDAELQWVSSTNQHPVIGQNLYRLKNGRFEQIGLSWLKHGFTALQGTVCSPNCVPSGTGSRLGLGCSDPYSSGLNGSQGGLGPRWQVNAFTGVFNYPYAEGTSGPTGDDIYKRVQVHLDDLNPGINVNAVYYIEGHYVTPDDAAAGNQHNNASYRQVFVTGAAHSGNYNLSLSGAPSTVRKKPAVFAWVASDPAVRVANIDVPSDGRLILVAKVTQNTGGSWHYEYALHNLNSDRSVAGFRVPLPANATVSNVGFHDANYHSGDGLGGVTYDGTDWNSVVGANEISWNMVDDFATDPNGNALRWGTLYNFRFDTDAPPIVDCVGALDIELFKPGTPVSVTAMTVVPSLCNLRGDLDGSGAVDGLDIAMYIEMRLGIVPVGPCADIAAPLNGVLNVFDDRAFISVLLGGPAPCH